MKRSRTPAARPSAAALPLLLALLACALPARATVAWVNVAAPRYGAGGFDDRPDDAAFAKALKASEVRRSAGKGRDVSVTLYIPRGRYVLSRTLIIPKWLNVVGDGSTAVQLDFGRLDSGKVALHWGGPVDNAFPGELVQVSGFSLIGPNDSLHHKTGTTGIHVGSQGRDSDAKLNLARLSGIQITHFQTGIRLGGLNYMNKFEHLYVRENGLGLDKPNVEGEHDNGENIAFEFCVFGNNLRHFTVNPRGGGGYGLRFTNCSFDYAHSTPEAEIGSAGMVVFDACHWETSQGGAPGEALLLRIVYPLANLMFINTEFKKVGGVHKGTPIQWASGSPSHDMNLTFMNCNFDSLGFVPIYGAKAEFRSTQPVALAIASPRLNADPGMVFHVDRGLGRPRPPRAAGTGRPGQAGGASGGAAAATKAGAGSGEPEAWFACIDAEGRLFKQAAPCN